MLHPLCTAKQSQIWSGLGFHWWIKCRRRVGQITDENIEQVESIDQLNEAVQEAVAAIQILTCARPTTRSRAMGIGKPKIGLLITVTTEVV
jgi:hypothetical protein